MLGVSFIENANKNAVFSYSQSHQQINRDDPSKQPKLKQPVHPHIAALKKTVHNLPHFLPESEIRWPHPAVTEPRYPQAQPQRVHSRPHNK